MVERHLLLSTLALACLALAGSQAHAAPSTSRGNISVAQVMEMIDKAGTDRVSAQTVTAYMFGVGETAGFLIATETRPPNVSVECKTSFSLDTGSAVAALRAAAPDPAQWQETLATPILVRDLLSRAGCS